MTAESPGLICYTHPGWEPRLRPASHRRGWMEDTPERFAYRCLPLAIANAQGWELLSPCGFEARWTGGPGSEAVEIRLDPGSDGRMAPVSLFGQGTITFHVEGIFRTPEGWNLLVGGPPNDAKDGIAPLSGVIETDWSPYSFTMNWRFTRPDHWVRFEENEPFCFFFPVQRGVLDAVEPVVRPMADEPGLAEAFTTWSQSRDAFHQWVQRTQPEAPADRWQKLYYRGIRPDGTPGATDHEAKVRLQAFRTEEAVAATEPRAGGCPYAPDAEGALKPTNDLAERRRAWIEAAAVRQRALAPEAENEVPRVHRLSGDDFLRDYYAVSRPVVIEGMIDAWPARTLWTPDYLKRKVGKAWVEYQADRAASPDFELFKDNHKQGGPFDAFIDRIAQPGNDAYLTAYNSAANRAALAVLDEDVGPLDAYLRSGPGMVWIGPGGTFTPLHFDLTNNLIVQVVGTKELLLAAPSATANLANRRHVFSEVHDLADPARLAAFPEASAVKPLAVILNPGDMLYVPVGWWHQVRARDFSVTLTYTDFKWANDAWETFPPDE